MCATSRRSDFSLDHSPAGSIIFFFYGLGCLCLSASLALSAMAFFIELESGPSHVKLQSPFSDVVLEESLPPEGCDFLSGVFFFERPPST